MANENLWSHEKWSATVDQLFGCFMVDCRPNLVTLAKIAFSGEYSIPGVSLSLNLSKGHTVLVASIDFININERGVTFSIFISMVCIWGGILKSDTFLFRPPTSQEGTMAERIDSEAVEGRRSSYSWSSLLLTRLNCGTYIITSCCKKIEDCFVEDDTTRPATIRTPQENDDIQYYHRRWRWYNSGFRIDRYGGAVAIDVSGDTEIEAVADMVEYIYFDTIREYGLRHASLYRIFLRMDTNLIKLQSKIDQAWLE